jgi:hypothetical protein
MRSPYESDTVEPGVTQVAKITDKCRNVGRDVSSSRPRPSGSDQWRSQARRLA